MKIDNIEEKVITVIMAAGKGTRMKSDTPKVLHTIFDKTLVGYVIDAVNKTGLVDENYIIVGHQAERVEEYVTKNYQNTKTVLQSPQLGTGHAVSMVLSFLNDFKGEVIILCGDTPLITEETLKDFIQAHYNKKSDLTVMSAIFENPTNYGRIIRNKDDSLNSIVEEKDATLEQKLIKEVNAGIYCINWERIKPAFSQLKTNNAQGEYYLTDIIKWANEQNLNVNAHILKNNEEIFGINSKIQLSEATKILNKKSVIRLMEEGVQIVDPDTTFISPETTIGADTLVLPNVYITGKNIIGKNCKIGPFAHIRDGATIGNNVRIGNFVEVKKSVIEENSKTDHLSYIGDAHLGKNVNIGAGTITANYNALTKEKCKTIICDDAKIGSNSVLVAPVRIENGANVGALSVITTDVPENSLAVTRSPMKIFKDWVLTKIKKDN
mgnify:CR=1 FL=1